MAKKEVVEALDLLLKDLMETRILFCGKVIFLVGISGKLFMLFVVEKEKTSLIKVCYAIKFGINLKNYIC